MGLGMVMVTDMVPNTTVNRTTNQLRWLVPSALRAPVSGYLERWAAKGRRS